MRIKGREFRSYPEIGSDYKILGKSGSQVLFDVLNRRISPLAQCLRHKGFYHPTFLNSVTCQTVRNKITLTKTLENNAEDSIRCSLYFQDLGILEVQSSRRNRKDSRTRDRWHPLSCCSQTKKGFSEEMEVARTEQWVLVFHPGTIKPHKYSEVSLVSSFWLI